MLPVAFDPLLPLVATSAFQAGEDVVAAGDVFDWRARGMLPVDVVAMVRAGLLTHPADAEPTRPETPKQKRKQRAAE